MTIKKIAFEVQSGLSKAHGIDVKRSHVHEVLAALYGYASYAALTNHGLLAQYIRRAPSRPLDIGAAAGRALDLGYSPPTPPTIAAVAASAAEVNRLCVVTIGDVLAGLGVEADSEDPAERQEREPDSHDFEAVDDWETRDEDVWVSIDLESALLRDNLLRLADGGSALAHLALAHLDDEFIGEESSVADDGSYWFEQQQAGRKLIGVELEWAERYLRSRQARTSREEHLRRAAALGSADAAMQRAEEHFSGETFEAAVRLAGDRHPARRGALAMSWGREDDALKWLRAAARRGNTDAMKTLASELEPDLKDAWTWVHLAGLLGVDVMAYHAVGDNGMPADADEAGPIYAAGGFELDRLSSQDDEAAKRRARELYEAIGSSR